MKISKFASTLITVFIFGLFSLSAQTIKKWEIDKAHASVNFSINHFFSPVTGNFKKFDGDFYFDENNLAASQFTFNIAVSSIDTDEPKRDAHLQSKDFFNAEKFPTIKFKSTSVTKKSKDQYIITGNLTMKDVTKKIELPLLVRGVMDNPWQEDKVIMGININTKLDRTDYGVGTGSWAATAVVANEVEININMELDGKK